MSSNVISVVGLALPPTAAKTGAAGGVVGRVPAICSGAASTNVPLTRWPVCVALVAALLSFAVTVNVPGPAVFVGTCVTPLTAGEPFSEPVHSATVVFALGRQ